MTVSPTANRATRSSENSGTCDGAGSGAVSAEHSGGNLVIKGS